MILGIDGATRIPGIHLLGGLKVEERNERGTSLGFNIDTVIGNHNGSSVNLDGLVLLDIRNLGIELDRPIIPLLGEVGFLAVLDILRSLGNLCGSLGILIFGVSLFQSRAGSLQGSLGLFGSHGLVLLEFGDEGFVLCDLVLVLLDHIVDGVTGEDGTLVHKHLGSLPLEFLHLEFLNFIKSFEVQTGIVLGTVSPLAFKGEDVVVKILFSLQDLLLVVDGVNLSLGYEVGKNVGPSLLSGFGGSFLNLKGSQTGLEVGLQHLELYLFFLHKNFRKLYLDSQELSANLFSLGLGKNHSGLGLDELGLSVFDGLLGIGIDERSRCRGLVKSGKRLELLCLSKANLRYGRRFLVLQAAREAQGTTEQRNE